MGQRTKMKNKALLTSQKKAHQKAIKKEHVKEMLRRYLEWCHLEGGLMCINTLEEIGAPPAQINNFIECVKPLPVKTQKLLAKKFHTTPEEIFGRGGREG